MAWDDSVKSDWSPGDVDTSADRNKVGDNLKYLKGKDGTVILEDGLNLGTNELTVNSVEIVGVDGEVNAAAIEDKFLRNDGNDSTTGDLTVANLITAGLVDGVDVSAHTHASGAGQGGVLDSAYISAASGIWGSFIDFTNWSSAWATISAAKSVLRVDIAGTALIDDQYGNVYTLTRGSFDFDKDFDWVIRLEWAGTANTPVTYIMVDDQDPSGLISDPSSNAIGFRIDANAVKGLHYGNGSLTVTDLSTSLSATNKYVLRVKYIAGTSITWYIGGSQVGTSSSDLPSGTQAATYYIIATHADNGDQIDWELHSWSWWMEA